MRTINLLCGAKGQDGGRGRDLDSTGDGTSHHSVTDDLHPVGWVSVRLEETHTQSAVTCVCVCSPGVVVQV